jgi:hypothetical protein
MSEVYTVCFLLFLGSQCNHLVITADESDLCTCFSGRQAGRQVNVSGNPVCCVSNRGGKLIV